MEVSWVRSCLVFHRDLFFFVHENKKDERALRVFVEGLISVQCNFILHSRALNVVRYVRPLRGRMFVGWYLFIDV